jgi:hypothetical protein
MRGLDAEIRRVISMAERAADLTPVMKGRAQQFIGVVQIAIGGGKDIFGKKLAELQDSTIEARRNKKKATIKPLIDTGNMVFRSLLARGTKTGMVFGSSDIEGKVNAHLFGSAKNKTPRRAFLPVDNNGRADFSDGAALEWWERTEQRIRAWIEKGQL